MKTTYQIRSHSSLLRAACATALVGFAALTATAQSQVDPSPGPSPASPVTTPKPLPSEDYSATDTTPMPNGKAERFINKLSMLQSEEARLSAIAAQRATNQQVRTFADQVRNASSTRDQELAQLAQTRGVLLPTGRDPNDLADENEKWHSKDAEDFDEDYVQRVIRIQKNSIDTLEDYASANDADPELVAFAQKHVAGLKESVRQAESLEDQVD